MANQVRAFRVRCTCLDPEIISITWAISPGQAKYFNWSAANGVGYGIKFSDLHVRRSPEYDNVPTWNKQGYMVDEKVLKHEIQTEEEVV